MTSTTTCVVTLTGRMPSCREPMAQVTGIASDFTNCYCDEHDREALPDDLAESGQACSPEGHAHADLLSAHAHTVPDDAVQTDRGQYQRYKPKPERMVASHRTSADHSET